MYTTFGLRLRSFSTSTIANDDITCYYKPTNNTKSQSYAVNEGAFFYLRVHSRMSDAGDEIQVDDAPVEEVEVAQEAPKGKLSVEDALQVRPFQSIWRTSRLDAFIVASFEERSRSRRSCQRSPRVRKGS